MLTKTDVLHHWSGDGYANESSEYDHKLELHFEYVLWRKSEIHPVNVEVRDSQRVENKWKEVASEIEVASKAQRFI